MNRAQKIAWFSLIMVTLAFGLSLIAVGVLHFSYGLPMRRAAGGFGFTGIMGFSGLAPLLFKKGDPQMFVEKQVNFKDMLPDFLVTIIPTIGGIILLFLDFKFLTLILVIILIPLSLGGNAFIRGSFACKYCKHKEIGCPAEQLFNK